jgi:hypothetical protein
LDDDSPPEGFLHAIVIAYSWVPEFAERLRDNPILTVLLRVYLDQPGEFDNYPKVSLFFSRSSGITANASFIVQVMLSVLGSQG